MGLPLALERKPQRHGAAHSAAHPHPHQSARTTSPWHPASSHLHQQPHPNPSLRDLVLGGTHEQPSSSGGGACQDEGWLGPARLASLAQSVGDQLRPMGDCPNDNHPLDRWINVATSLPFIGVGMHALRRRRTSEGRQQAWMMMGVGLTATAYHAASGRARELARKLDYWMIAACSVQTIKTLFADRRLARGAMNLSLLAVPFRPLWVTTASTLAMQGEFVRQAAAHKAIRPALRAHLLASTAGAAAFVAEDVLMERGCHLVHAVWHLLSCAAVTTMNGLLEHKERQQIQARYAAAAAAAVAATAAARRGAADGGDSLCKLGGLGGKPLRRPLHSSATSLEGLHGGSPAGGSPRSPPLLRDPGTASSPPPALAVP